MWCHGRVYYCFPYATFAMGTQLYFCYHIAADAGSSSRAVKIRRFLVWRCVTPAAAKNPCCVVLADGVLYGIYILKFIVPTEHMEISIKFIFRPMHLYYAHTSNNEEE